MSEKVYGIDLGTTNSAIAVYENGETRILKNMDGDEVTPSVVLFTSVDEEGKDEVLVGSQAREEAASSPDTVVQFVKRNIGKKGAAVQFTAPSGKVYTPEMISSLILQKVCRDAEKYAGEEEVKDVVITVPAYFDDARRTATKQAGMLAGLNVLDILNEPTAAAVAFGLGREFKGRILVYDLGGGTFDVTIMDIDDGKFTVLATGGDPQLGGINFDQEISGLIIKKLEEQGISVDYEDDERMAEIREKAETTKKQLTNVEHSHPVFRFREDGKTQNVRLDISREEFEAAAEQLMRRTQFIIEDVMKQKEITWEQIDEIIIVGGSTKMPIVIKWLENLSGKTISREVDPDTVVAKGAAIFASTVSKRAENQETGSAASEAGEVPSGGLVISDVTSQSLGIVSIDPADPVGKKEVNSVIIPNNTVIPAKRSREFRTVVENQTSVKIQVTEGNDPELEYVNIIGETVLQIPPYPKGSPIEVIFAYDANQMVYVEVIDLVAQKSLGTFDIERRSNLTAEQLAQAEETVRQTSVE